MRQTLINGLRAATVLAALCTGISAQAADQRGAGVRHPNILLVIADDIGLDVNTGMYPGLVDALVRQYGPQGLKHPGYESIRGKPASTPRLDQFARQGMVFSNAWAEPFCSPTRATILTGLYAVKARVLSYADPLSSHYTSIAQLLKQEGYSTGLFGKWHLAGLAGNPSFPGMKPKQAGFDIFRGNLNAAIKSYWDYDYQVQDADSPADKWRTERPPVKSLPGIAPTNYGPVVKIADALEWITAQEKASPDKPWFAWVAFNLAHATTTQRPSQMAVPNADTLDAASLAEMQACGGVFGTNDPGNCSGESLMRAMSNSLDTIFGKLVDAVEGLDPNTYVIYIGDNGTPMYGRPQLDFIDNMYITRKDRGKGTAYESGARIPMAIRGPGVAAKAASAEYVHTADLFPTILTLAGLKPPTRVSNAEGNGTLDVDGLSLVPLLTGKTKTVRDPVEGFTLTESLNLMKEGLRQVAARNGQYKVICTTNTQLGSCEFYDLVKDPLEEYPLDKPASCSGREKRGAQDWHYCRLAGFIQNQSFLGQVQK